MTYREYYNLPEGSNATLRFLSKFDEVGSDFLAPANMGHAYSNEPKRTAVKIDFDTSQTTHMNHMFAYNSSLKGFDIDGMDTSNVTTMAYMFASCSGLAKFIGPKWNTSKVTNMENMFDNDNALRYFDISNWDTSKVTTFDSMIPGYVEYIGAINCGGLTAKNKYPLKSYSTCTALTETGGFIDAKMSWDDNYGLAKCPNLTYESCINILNGLHDFTGNGETPTSSQGVLKVHANFLTTVGDEITIGTNKGWSIQV